MYTAVDAVERVLGEGGEGEEAVVSADGWVEW